jgi:uncharacterized membrane protein YhaH (DUF805 family)
MRRQSWRRSRRRGTIGGMSSLALLAPSGRLARRPFAIAVSVVYVLNFLSQVLLIAPVTGRMGLWPFALAQAVLIWAWFVLHARRLRDAGRGPGTALGIAILYTLAVVLVLLIMAMFTATDSSIAPIKDGQGLLRLFVVVFVLMTLLGDPSVGVLWYWLLGFVVLLLTPVVIALGFTIWTATRPSVPAVS